MKLYLWSDLIEVDDLNNSVVIQEPEWSKTKEEAEEAATESIREEVDDGADPNEIANVYIYGIDFEPNPATLVALLSFQTYNVGKYTLTEDDPSTTIEIVQVGVIEAKDVEPSPDDDDFDEGEDEEKEG